jgi:hypothetical protein
MAVTEPRPVRVRFVLRKSSASLRAATVSERFLLGIPDGDREVHISTRSSTAAGRRLAGEGPYQPPAWKSFP